MSARNQIHGDEHAPDRDQGRPVVPAGNRRGGGRAALRLRAGCHDRPDRRHAVGDVDRFRRDGGRGPGRRRVRHRRHGVHLRPRPVPPHQPPRHPDRVSGLSGGHLRTAGRPGAPLEHLADDRQLEPALAAVRGRRVRDALHDGPGAGICARGSGTVRLGPDSGEDPSQADPAARHQRASPCPPCTSRPWAPCSCCRKAGCTRCGSRPSCRRCSWSRPSGWAWGWSPSKGLVTSWLYKRKAEWSQFGGLTRGSGDGPVHLPGRPPDRSGRPRASSATPSTGRGGRSCSGPR